jgi:hypothetical protein
MAIHMRGNLSAVTLLLGGLVLRTPHERELRYNSAFRAG